LGKSQKPPLGKSQKPFLGKKNEPPLGKSQKPFLGKKNEPLLGKGPSFGERERTPFGEGEWKKNSFEEGEWKKNLFGPLLTSFCVPHLRCSKEKRVFPFGKRLVKKESSSSPIAEGKLLSHRRIETTLCLAKKKECAGISDGKKSRVTKDNL